MSISLDNLKASVYSYQKAVTPQFQSICEPLFKLGIKYFSYYKIFEDGGYFFLMNNLEYCRLYLSTIKNNGKFFTEHIQRISKNRNNYLLLDDITQFNRQEDPIIHLLHDCNMWNNFYIFRLNGQNFFECYIFMMEKSDALFSPFYLNNIALLEHFCDYFKEKAHELLKGNDKSKLAYFEQQFNFNNTSQEDRLALKAEQFLRETFIRKRTLKTRGKEIQLTPRESECLHYLSLGKTAKEMARILGLSPHTIYFYLNNLRTKSRLKRGELISYFSKSSPKDIERDKGDLKDKNNEN